MSNETYIVYQAFETLGDSARERFASRADAEECAAGLRAMITEMVAEWNISEPEHPTGNSSEIGAWIYAAKLSAGSEKFTLEAAEFLAEQAVMIEIETEPECR